MNKNVYYSTEITVEDLDIKEGDVILAISSIIYIVNPYIPKSAFTPQQRFDQTIKQLKCIRERNIPSLKVILQEMSEMIGPPQINQLAELCDIVILYKGNRRTQLFCHQIGNKGLGELSLLEHLSLLLQYTKFRTLIKFSGRYELGKNFKLDDYTRDAPVARTIIHDQIFTIIYSIPKECFSEYIKHIYKNV